MLRPRKKAANRRGRRSPGREGMREEGRRNEEDRKICGKQEEERKKNKNC